MPRGIVTPGSAAKTILPESPPVAKSTLDHSTRPNQPSFTPAVKPLEPGLVEPPAVAVASPTASPASPGPPLASEPLESSAESSSRVVGFAPRGTAVGIPI